AIKHAVDHRGVADAGADRVDANAPGGVFQCRGTGQLQHAALGGTVGRRAFKADQAGHRGDIDDGTAAFLRQHGGNLVLHAQPHAFQVDGHDAVEVFFRAVGGGGNPAFNAGVVAGGIQPPVG